MTDRPCEAHGTTARRLAATAELHDAFAQSTVSSDGCVFRWLPKVFSLAPAEPDCGHIHSYSRMLFPRTRLLHRLDAFPYCATSSPVNDGRAGSPLEEVACLQLAQVHIPLDPCPDGLLLDRLRQCTGPPLHRDCER